MRAARLSALLAAPALAQPIPIADPGFELQSLTPCSFTAAFASGGWVRSGGDAGTWRPGTCWDITPFEGSQVAYSNGGVVTQQLTTLASPGGSYTLSFAIGHRNNGCCPFSPATISLLAGATVLGSTTITAAQAPAPGAWGRYSFTTSAPTSLPANLVLAIRFSAAGSQTDFDSFFLESAPACGSADFDCDGDTGTDADIEAFFACIAGNCPLPPCTSSGDFNNDGDTATDADIEAFFRVLAGGTC